MEFENRLHLLTQESGNVKFNVKEVDYREEGGIMEILIIGGIAAGMSTAAKAQRENKEANITVIEMEDYISFGACGLPYYLGGQFEDSGEMFARSVEQMQEVGLNILTNHQALELDIENKQVKVKNLLSDEVFMQPYDRLMIATGASPIKPAIQNVDAPNVYTMTKLYDVQEFKDNLSEYEMIGVIGGGFIGVEVAEQLAQLGKKVTLIHSPKLLMNKPFDPEFSMRIQNALEEVGVVVKTEERVQKFHIHEGLINQIETLEQRYDVDAVVLAIGFKPNTEFLNNQIRTLSNGALVINQYGQTTQDDIFAAGDCASIHHRFLGNYYNPLATYANKMGRIIGTNIVNEPDRWLSYHNVLGTAAIKAGHYEAVVTGLNETQAKSLGLDIKTSLIETNTHTSYYPGQTPIMIKLVYDANTKVLYGAQMLGIKDTVLRATGYTTAIHAGLTTHDIGFIDYAYSPPFSSTWEALNVAANTAK